ncbi:MAG TPA: ABC transporter ATP-binding protein [Candidatus Methylomirabilis sp.]|nr:ABC transporter ATP-binding protein [Candidatus Methylomirabilis sp.]
MTAKVDARGIFSEFGTPTGPMLALRQVDLTAQEGEFVTLLGESGCGKTTLLRILAGLLPPARGEVRIDGSPVTGPHPQVGIVFQRPVLLPWRTARENVLLPAQVHGLPLDRAGAEANGLLASMGLQDFVDRFPRHLSGGMQQRVSIARALLLHPSILLMDEPFGALDAITREQMHLDLLNVWRDHRPTIVFVTHDIAEAVFLADRLVLLSPRPGTVRQIFAVPLPRPRVPDHRFTAEFAATCREVKHAMQMNGGEAG